MHNLDDRARKCRESYENLLYKQGKNSVQSIIFLLAYIEWLFEGPKLLALKREILKRLPDNMTYSLDQVSDSRYTSPAFDIDSVLDGVEELNKLASEIDNFTTQLNPDKNQLSS